MRQKGNWWMIHASWQHTQFSWCHIHVTLQDRIVFHATILKLDSLFVVELSGLLPLSPVWASKTLEHFTSLPLRHHPMIFFHFCKPPQQEHTHTRRKVRLASTYPPRQRRFWRSIISSSTSFHHNKHTSHTLVRPSFGQGRLQRFFFYWGLVLKAKLAPLI